MRRVLACALSLLLAVPSLSGAPGVSRPLANDRTNCEATSIQRIASHDPNMTVSLTEQDVAVITRRGEAADRHVAALRGDRRAAVTRAEAAMRARGYVRRGTIVHQVLHVSRLDAATRARLDLPMRLVPAAQIATDEGEIAITEWDDGNPATAEATIHGVHYATGAWDASDVQHTIDTPDYQVVYAESYGYYNPEYPDPVGAAMGGAQRPRLVRASLHASGLTNIQGSQRTPRHRFMGWLGCSAARCGGCAVACIFTIPFWLPCWGVCCGALAMVSCYIQEYFLR